MDFDNLFMDGYEVPKPLSKKESNELFKKAKQGNLEARNKLIEYNIRLVLKEVTCKFKSVEYDKNDLVSIGIIGLIKAVDEFDISKNISFSSFAIRCIDNEILMLIRKQKKYKNTDSIDKVINYDKDGNEFKIKDTIKDETDLIMEYETKETYQIIRILIKKLPSKDKKIIMLYYGFFNDKRYTQKEISEIMSISQPYVSKLIKRITKQLGEDLQSMDIVPLKKEYKPIITQPKPKSYVVNKSYTGRKVQSIYKYFKDYSKEQIDEMLDKLNADEKELILLRYGADLNNPISIKLSKENNYRFYKWLVPKMRKMLLNLKEEKNKRLNEAKKQIINLISNETSLNNNYNNIQNMLKLPIFKKVLNSFSEQEIVITFLKLGIIDGKCFSTSEISNFLDIDENVVINTTKLVLFSCQSMINEIIDYKVKLISEDSDNEIDNQDKSLKYIK